MKNTQTFQLVMLPTEKASKIHLYEGILYKTPPDLDPNIPQHLYILSDEEIKEGDWVFSIKDCGFAPQIFKNNVQDWLEETGEEYDEGCKKIIATTDKSLGLPLIHDSFLPPFIKAYNDGKQITEIDLEIDNYIPDTDGDLGPDTDGDLGTPLTRKDGTVIILETKKYSKQDLMNVIKFIQTVPFHGNYTTEFLFNKVVENNII